DGIRDDLVTGVQTCALPISWNPAASDREHGRQGGAGREAQFFAEPTPCGGGRAQGRAERAGFQAQFFTEPRTGGRGGPQGWAKRARREAQLLSASGACRRSRTQGRTGEPRQWTLDLTNRSLTGVRP